MEMKTYRNSSKNKYHWITWCNQFWNVSLSLFYHFFQSFVDNSKRTPTKLSYFGKDQAASQFSQRLMADSRNLFKISWNLFLVLQKLFLQGPRLKKWAKKQLNQVKTSTKIDTFFSQNLAKMQPEVS